MKVLLMVAAALAFLTGPLQARADQIEQVTLRLEGETRTVAELGDEWKAVSSHRALAAGVVQLARHRSAARAGPRLRHDHV